jgi:hypothetical protein
VAQAVVLLVVVALPTDWVFLGKVLLAEPVGEIIILVAAVVQQHPEPTLRPMVVQENPAIYWVQHFIGPAVVAELVTAELPVTVV